MGQVKDKMIVGIVLALTLVQICVAETEYGLARYDVILARSPFGSGPLANEQTTDVGVEEEITAAALEQICRLSYLYKSESGEVQAGFQNLKPKPGEPLSSIVMLGESFMGMQLRSVDMENSKATLLHKGQLIPLKLTKQKLPAKAVSVTPTTSRRRSGGDIRPAQSTKAMQPQLSPAELQKRREEMRKKLQGYQMEVIRKGMPPLPVPLTQEMDDQLVSEGVLPPAQ